MRQTRQRETILEILKSTRCHPTADWVYEQARKVIPNISLGTIYRNLNLLVEHNQAFRVEHNHVCRYDGHIENHYHLFCTHCGKVCDVNVPIDSSLNKKAAQSTGCNVISHRAMFFGICSDCQLT
jgi:Fe2+ or Zn2+ uptake regulation protein